MDSSVKAYKFHYKKYLDFMEKAGKKSKIPKRVYDRLK